MQPEFASAHTPLGPIRGLVVLLVGIASLLGVTFVVIDGTHRSIESYLEVIGGFATNDENTVEATLLQLQSAITEDQCSLTVTDKLATIGLLPDGIGEIVFLPGMGLPCSTRGIALGRFDLAGLGEPDAAALGPHNLSLWFDRNLETLGLGGVTANLISDGRFVLIAPFDMPRQEDIASGVTPAWLSVELGLLRPDGTWVHRAGPELFATGISPVIEGLYWQQASYSLSRCGGFLPYCVIASTHTTQIFDRYLAMFILLILVAPILSMLAGDWTHRRLARFWSFEERFVRSLGRGEIACVYQPIFDLATNRVDAIEVLARWREADGRLVTPDRFLDIVSRRNLTIPFTRAVIERAMGEIGASLAEAGPLEVHFNIFPRDFRAAEIAPLLTPHMRELPWIHPVVEITEEERFDEHEIGREIRELRALGIKTFIDDFGSGYSNIGQLGTLPIDGVKLDKSFAMARPGTVLALLMGSVLRLIREANREIVVEGVESEERLEEVRGMGAAGVQGYVFGTPVGIAELAGFLKRPLSPRIARFRAARTA